MAHEATWCFTSVVRVTTFWIAFVYCPTSASWRSRHLAFGTTQRHQRSQHQEPQQRQQQHDVQPVDHVRRKRVHTFPDVTAREAHLLSLHSFPLAQQELSAGRSQNNDRTHLLRDLYERKDSGDGRRRASSRTPAPAARPADDPSTPATTSGDSPAPVEAPADVAESTPVPAPDVPTEAPMKDDTPAPIDAQEDTAEPTPAPNTAPSPAPTAPESPVASKEEGEPADVTQTVAPTPVPIDASSPAPSSAAPVSTPTPSDAIVDTEKPADPNDKVETPYFMDSSTRFTASFTFHIQCDTEGAVILYTLDGTDPATSEGDEDNGSSTAREVPAGESVFVRQIGTVVIRAVATKEGMADSDEVSKTVLVQDLVADPVLYFAGERAGDDVEGEYAFLRTVIITMNCSTPNATLSYTVNGITLPGEGEESISVAPGTQVQWSEEGTTEFDVVAFADGYYKSEVTKWEVTIVAPRIDEHAMADAPDGSADVIDGDMIPEVTATGFEAVYAPPGAELEQQEQLGPGYGVCESGGRIVRGKLLVVSNPKRHLSFAAPLDACGSGNGGDDEDEAAFALASETASTYQPFRQTAELLEGESPEDASIRLNIAAREAAWQAAGGNNCQAMVAGGLLSGGEGGSCVVGHLVSGGQVIRADEGTALVSFGVRAGSFVVGAVTADEVRDEDNPFQDLVSGAGWLVRAGVNHVEASARDGHLDILRNEGEETVGEDEKGQGLDDVLTAKLARTAIGHDAEGRLILLQTSGAATGSDQDTAMPDGLDLKEFADVLVEAGAVNAVNLIGGGPAAMTLNGSAIVDPAGPCEGDDESDGGEGGFLDGSSLPRCEKPVSSVICVHLDPPPMVAGVTTDSETPSPIDAASAASSNEGDWTGGWSSSSSGSSNAADDGEDEVRLQWANDLCSSNGTGNATGLWEHLDDVEEAALRYKIAFWVVTVLGMASLYFNIQHQKGSSSGLNEHGLVGQGAPYGRNLQRVPGNNVGLIDGGIAATTGVEMGKIGSKRGSRKSSSRRKGSSSKSGGYAKVNGDADWDGGDGGATVYGMDSEEEVDLGLTRSRPPSSRKHEKSKASRLRRALARVSSRGGAEKREGPETSALDHGEGQPDPVMAINPFGGAQGAGVDREQDMYIEEGTWS